MRTIKFRGKRIDNGEWIYGNLFIPNKFVKGVYICPDTTFADFMPDFSDGDKIEDHAGSGISLGHFHEVIPESVGQFTGLLDCNSKEIYNKDICRWIGNNGYEIVGVIAWEQQACAYWLKWEDGKSKRYKELQTTFSDGDIYMNNYFEVIGSTTDTPELLTDKQK